MKQTCTAEGFSVQAFAFVRVRMAEAASTEFVRVNGKALREFCTRALIAAGSSEKQAEYAADV